MTRTIQVRAPCRLHFGMFGFGPTWGSLSESADAAPPSLGETRPGGADSPKLPDSSLGETRPQFGGVGVMVDSPAVEVTIAPASDFRVIGSLAERARQLVELAATRWQLRSLPACHISVRSPADHTGLGVGTQLALSLAVGLRRFLDLPAIAPAELAASVGRGTRSGVGTHGFHYGGLIVDAGKRADQSLGTLVRRVPLPDAWRFVLVRVAGQGLAGDIESRAFAKLPPVPSDVTAELWRITKEEMLPAVERDDCAAFGEAVYQFGRLAGECFAPVQGGPFANREIARLVGMIRDYGLPGVGQSSWGPTVFAITRGEKDAQALAGWLRKTGAGLPSDVTVARPNNRGAAISSQPARDTA